MAYYVKLEMGNSIETVDKSFDMHVGAEAWGRYVRAAEARINDGKPKKACNISLYNEGTLLQRRIMTGEKP